METIWAFLPDPGNRAVLTWVGGGLAAVAGGFWTVLTYLGAKGGSQKNASPGILAGRDVSIAVTHASLRPVLLSVLVLGLAMLALPLLYATTVPGVSAERGIAIGGDATDSTITVHNK
jgi:hypothetical protein